MLTSHCIFVSAIGNTVAKRLTSRSQWAGEGASNALQVGASKRRSAKNEAPAKKKINQGAAVTGGRRSSRFHGDDLVSILFV